MQNEKKKYITKRHQARTHNNSPFINPAKTPLTHRLGQAIPAETEAVEAEEYIDEGKPGGGEDRETVIEVYVAGAPEYEETRHGLHHPDQQAEEERWAEYLDGEKNTSGKVKEEN